MKIHRKGLLPYKPEPFLCNSSKVPTYGATQGTEESNLRKITAKFPGKLRHRSSLLFQIQERDQAKRPGVLLRVC